MALLCGFLSANVSPAEGRSCGGERSSLRIDRASDRRGKDEETKAGIWT